MFTIFLKGGIHTHENVLVKLCKDFIIGKVVVTVGAVGLLSVISFRDVVGVASVMGGVSPDSDSSQEVARASDSSSD